MVVARVAFVQLEMNWSTTRLTPAFVSATRRGESFILAQGGKLHAAMDEMDQTCPLK
jgi:hypothetical protein